MRRPGVRVSRPIDVGTSCARSDFLFHKKSVTRSTVPPFPQKVPLRLRCSLVNALATLRLATNFLRVQVYFKIFCRHLFCSPRQHVGARSALLRLIFLPVASKYAIRHPLSPPLLLLFSGRTHARLTRSVKQALSRRIFAVAPDLSRVRI